MSKVKGDGKKKGGLLFIAAGLGLIIFVSLMDGFSYSFVRAIDHIISDLTIDIKVHAYIAGLVLLLYGIYKKFVR